MGGLEPAHEGLAGARFKRLSTASVARDNWYRTPFLFASLT